MDNLEELFAEGEKEIIEQKEKEAVVRKKKVARSVRQIAGGNTSTRRRESWEGIYEYHDHNRNSHKFYRVERLATGEINVRWGRMGAYGQQKTYDFAKGYKKVDEKIAKGYERVSDL